MHTRILYLVIVILIQGSVIFGQNGTNSPYSRFGFGAIDHVGFGKNQAMGGVGIAIRSNSNMSPLNPASYSAIDTLSQIFEFGLSGSRVRYQDATQSAYDNEANFNYLGISVPATKWWGMGFGVTPVSFVGYDYGITTSNNDITDRSFAYYGEGGISKVFWGNSFEIYERLSLGVSLNYLFGSLDHHRNATFPDETDYISFASTEKIVLNALQYNFGLQYVQPINETHRIVVGATYEPKTGLNAKHDLQTYRVVPVTGGQTLIDEVTDEAIDMEFPESYGLGIAYEISDKLQVGADYYTQKFGETDFYSTDSLQNRQRFAVGVEYIPNHIHQNYVQRIKYRFGANISNNYQKLYGSDVVDFGITFGLGLPLGFSKTSFNVAFEYGKIGTTKNNLVREDYLKVVLNLSLNDIWFVKRKFK